MAADSPKLAGYTFKHPPKPINVYWEPQIIAHQLSDGSTKTYNKGYVLRGALEWGKDGWVESDDMSNIAVMFNQMTATAQFYPRPDTYPTRKFNVQIIGGFNFVPHDGHLQAGRQFFEGSIVFESSPGDMTATASVIF